MNPGDFPGSGDETTWGVCMGHPNDPRTDHDAYEKQVGEAVDNIKAALKADNAPTAVEVAENLLKYADTADVAVALVELMQHPAKAVETFYEIAFDAIIITAQNRVAAMECGNHH